MNGTLETVDNRFALRFELQVAAPRRPLRTAQASCRD